MGVGEKPKENDLADYVLGRFSKEESSLIGDGTKEALQAVEMMLAGDTDRAMNEFNRKV